MPPSTTATAAETKIEVPLAVDLDGTLIRTDMLWESFARLLRRNPLYAFAALFWWSRGRANLKRQLALRVQIDPRGLPYHEPFIAFLRAEKARGRRVLLATASDLRMARPVADHTGVFDEVLASDGKHNLRGSRKGYVLSERFGKRGFDYAGNSHVDLAVWAEAREAIVVNASQSLADRAAKNCRVGRTFLEPQRFAWYLLQEFRPQRWPKNALVWLPLVRLSHADAVQMNAVTWTFVAFCVCAAAAYLWNDLLDLDEDRQHPARRQRPFASGQLPLPIGIIAAPMLAAAGVLLGTWQSWSIGGVLLAYLVGTVVYTTQLKRLAAAALLGLTGLNLLRVVAGVFAVGLDWSWSLLAVPAVLCAGLAAVRFYFLRK